MRGKKGTPHPHLLDPPRTRANQKRGRGTYNNDRPPIISVICRESGEVRYWVREHADKASTRSIIRATIPPRSTLLFTDEATNYTGLHPQHATVCHSQREWARDDDRDGLREVHCNSCEGMGAALRTYLRVFRGVHKYYLAEYVATFETLFNTKAISPAVIQAMCLGERLHPRDS
jgi:transposase-like protein